uniref:hypothetical protein n=1 Tax=Agathobacter sp. TaxID=2021311 RepID=UPI004055B6AB
MFRVKKCVLFIAAAALLFTGCAAAEMKQEDTTREVSSKFRGMGQSGLLVEEGELKESGVIYEDAAITFQDEVIEEMLRNIIGKPKGEVYISELQEIHAIYWRHDHYWSNLQSPDGCLPHISGCKDGPWETRQPESLKDLAYCYNLQWMEFGEIEVPSLEPLCDLPQLETLGFGGASVTEEVLEEIGELPVLKYLEIGNENGTDWGNLTDGSFLLPLADRLIELEAGGGIHWNVEVLSEMKKLESLMIDYAEDISFLTQMPELKKLYLYCCTPKEWSPLSGLENLEYLVIHGNYKTTVDIGLQDLTPLVHLDYLGIRFTSINTEYNDQEIVDALPSLTGLVTQ